MSTISQSNLDFSNKVKSDITIAVKDGAATTTVSENLYGKNLPEGLTPEIIKDVSNYNGTFMAGVTHAFGHQALATLKKNKTLESVTAVFPMAGKDRLEVTVDRSGEVRKPGSGEVSTQYGVTTAKYVVHEGRQNRGQLQAVRDSIKEAAATALGK